jgi:hypothetical protein
MRCRKASKPELLTIPGTLPDEFFQRLPIPRDADRYVALFWEPAIDDLLIYNGRAFRRATDDWPFLALQCHEQVGSFLCQHDVQLGNSWLAASHWLIVDPITGAAWVAPRNLARRCVEQQQLARQECLAPAGQSASTRGKRHSHV